MSKKNTKKITKFKIWLMEKGFRQSDLAKKTDLSTNTINTLINTGKASKSVIKLVAYSLNISTDELNKLLKQNKLIIHKNKHDSKTNNNEKKTKD